MIPLAPAEPRELAALYRMLARLYAAGIPPLQMAATLQQSPQGRHARPAAEAFVEAFQRAGLPSRELAKRKAVPRPHVGVIAAAESIGGLERSLDQLAAGCEQEARVRAQAWKIALEPLVAWVVIACIVPIGHGIAGGLGAYLRIALPLLALPFVLMAALQRSRARGVVPGFAEVARLAAVARFCRTLATLNAAGLPLPRSLREAAEAAAHVDVTPRAQRVAAAVERGATVTEALRAQGVLRPVEAALVADGEATGRLDVAFGRAAGLLEHEAFQKARWRLRVVGAALFVALAIDTGWRVARGIQVARGVE